MLIRNDQVHDEFPGGPASARAVDDAEIVPPGLAAAFCRGVIGRSHWLKPTGQRVMALVLLGSIFGVGSTCRCAAEEPAIRILHRATVFHHTGTDPKDPANATGFNHCPSLTLLPDGRLLAVWISGPFEGSSRQKLLGSFSSDQGRTWSAADTVQDFPGKADFDPAFVASGKKTFLFFSAGLWQTYPYETGQVGPVGGDSFRVYLRESEDSGRTWSLAREIYSEPGHSSRTNGISLASGELLVPIHRNGTRSGGVLKSTDDGRTWKRYGHVANPAGHGGEPTIAELKSGKVMMLLRTKDGELWRAYSSDQGESWTTPDKTGLPATASSHNLFRTRDGVLVLTHNPSKPSVRTPLTMRLSFDDGATWVSPTVIAEIEFPVEDVSWQVCYPSVVEFPDRTLAVVWVRRRHTPDELYGDIHAARVALRAPGR
jgi:predicted neuraminidase